MDTTPERLKADAKNASGAPPLRAGLFALSPLNQRRWNNFKKNRRGYWSFWLFLVLFVLSLGAEFIANDKPILIRHDGAYYMPVFNFYPETAFGGDFGQDDAGTGRGHRDRPDPRGGREADPDLFDHLDGKLMTDRALVNINTKKVLGAAAGALIGGALRGLPGAAIGGAAGVGLVWAGEKLF